ncbi:MAG TPA: glycoside hydrolase family 130 protein [Gemmatimonadales bacterium]
MTLVRHVGNPIITRVHIPALSPHFTDVTSVFNPGAVRRDGAVHLMLRVQSRGRETALVMARSRDGVAFTPAREAVRFDGIERLGERLFHVYDPRMTVLDDTVYIMFAADTERGCRLGLARSQDLVAFEFVALDDAGDVRNGVLFPQRFGDNYLRLDRPNRLALTAGPTSGDEIMLSRSADLVHWEAVGPVMRGRPHAWDERIGSGPPPVKTRDGWLHLYHGVATHFASTNVYQAGVVLLDLDDPTRVIARGRNNVLEPREPYELVGQVPNVVFPSGMIVERVDDDGYAEPDSRVLLYYGAADTVVGLATSTVADLLAACRLT